jgi:hypothetical protein
MPVQVLVEYDESSGNVSVRAQPAPKVVLVGMLRFAEKVLMECRPPAVEPVTVARMNGLLGSGGAPMNGAPRTA